MTSDVKSAIIGAAGAIIAAAIGNFVILKPYIDSITPGPFISSFFFPDAGQKICSVSSGTFRSTTVVPKNWTSETCLQLAIATTHTRNINLGCAREDKVSLDEHSPMPPDNFCGWK